MLPDPRRSAAFLLTGLSALLSAGSTLADLGARALRPSRPDTDDDRPAPPRDGGVRPGPPPAGADRPGPPRSRAGGPPPGPRPQPTPTTTATTTPGAGPSVVVGSGGVGSGGPAPAPPRSVLDERDTPPVGDADRSRTSESHTEEMANQPAAAVIRAVREASTDDLERLYDHERSHRARKSVLAAIERALAPPSAP